MNCRKIVALALCTLSLPLMADNNKDLVIVNDTAYPSTSKINNQKNNAQCSNKIPAYGVTFPHTTNRVPARIVASACITNMRSCTADIYMTEDCTGPIVAMAVFDTKNGIISLINLNPDSFTVNLSTADPFYIQITGGSSSLS